MSQLWQLVTLPSDHPRERALQYPLPVFLAQFQHGLLHVLRIESDLHGKLTGFGYVLKLGVEEFQILFVKGETQRPALTRL